MKGGYPCKIQAYNMSKYLTLDMPGARHPLPFEMRGIKTDPPTGRYILSENDV